MFKVENVSLTTKWRRFGPVINILNDVSFKVNPNEAIGIIGKSGEGKTTLLRIMQGNPTPFPKTTMTGNVFINEAPLFDVQPKTLFNRKAKKIPVEASRQQVARNVAFMDEAYAGGNKDDAPMAQLEVKSLKDRGRSAVLVTHNLPAVAQAVDRILHLYDGSIVWDGTYSEMCASKDSLPNPTQEYLGYVKKVFDWEP